MTIATETDHLNAVDIETVGGLAAKIQECPEVAETKWAATVTWTSGFRSEARIRDFDPIRSDEPLTLGGDDSAPNPVEQLLGAFGNCLAVGYAANATVRGIELNSVEIDLSGDLNLETFLGLAPEGNAGYEGIKVDVRIESDASPEQLAELHEAVVATSPVGHTLSRPVPVDVQLL